MTTIRDLLQQGDPLADEGEWSADARARARQMLLQAREAAAPPHRRAVVKMLPAAFVLIAGLGAGASFLSPGGGGVIAAVRFEVHAAEDTPGNDLRAVVIGDSKRTIYLHPEVVVSNGDIANASAQQNREGGGYSVVVTFTADGARKMEAATRGHVGKPLAVLIDGQVVTAPTVRGAIGTSAVLDAHYTKAEADRIVAGILGR